MRKVLLCIVALATAAAPAFAGDGKVRRRPHPIQNEYIVVLADDILPEQVPDVVQSLARAHDVRPGAVWQYALKGFWAEMPEARAAALARNPRVKYVEENSEVFFSGTPVTVSTKVDPATGNTTTDNRLWHLDRLSQTWASRDGSSTSCYDGTGVTVYVVDTGVIGQHQEFLRDNGTSRVQTGFDATSDYTENGVAYYPANNPCFGFADDKPVLDTTDNDRYYYETAGNGHGTAVASLVAGRYSGVAKNATIVPVKMAPCERNASRHPQRNTSYAKGRTVTYGSYFYVATSGGTTGSSEPYIIDSNGIQRLAWTALDATTFSDGTVTWTRRATPSVASVRLQISALEWIISPQNTYSKSPAVVTMSTYQLATTLGVDEPPNGSTHSLEDAARNVANGTSTSPAIPFIVSANNQGDDACRTSPARMSRNSTELAARSKIITAGGSMIVNIPDPLGSDVLVTEEANGGSNINAVEPAYDATKPTLDARWRCIAGDSSMCTKHRTEDTNANNDTQISTGDQTGSNGGPCVTLFAPAKNLNVASLANSTAYRDPRRTTATSASGTSWSAPIVAGVVARMLEADSTLTPDQIHTKLMDHAIYGVLKNDSAHPLDPPNVTPGSTPNILLNMSDVSIGTQPQDKTSSASATATLSVTATGIGTLTYQWYKVNSGFDLTKRRGATSSDVIPGATSATLTGLNPSVATGYWVRVRSGCAQVESDIAVVTPLALDPPANVVATASGTTVTVQWELVTGAAGYKVERKVAGTNWSTAQTVTSGTQLSATDQPVAPSGVVLYRVRATAGGGESEASNNDVAFVGTFTDDPVATSAPFTNVKAVHITEIRQAVNALLDIVGLTPVYGATATDPALLSGSPIDDTDFLTLRTNLNAARTAQGIGMSQIDFRTTPAANGAIWRTQIEDLRNGLK